MEVLENGTFQMHGKNQYVFLTRYQWIPLHAHLLAFSLIPLLGSHISRNILMVEESSTGGKENVHRTFSRGLIQLS